MIFMVRVEDLSIIIINIYEQHGEFAFAFMVPTGTRKHKGSEFQ